MNNEGISGFLLGLFIGTVICLTINLYSEERGAKKVRAEAVENGFGKWATDKVVTFEWNPPCNKITKETKHEAGNKD